MLANKNLNDTLNKKNNVKSLTDQQIVDIYTGKIKNWKDVGGSDKEITVVNKAEGRSTLELFLQYYKLKNLNCYYYLLVIIGLIAIPVFLNLIHFPNTQPYDTATGGVLSIAKNGRAPQFMQDEVDAIVKTANDYGFKVAAHAHGGPGGD